MHHFVLFTEAILLCFWITPTIGGFMPEKPSVRSPHKSINASNRVVKMNKTPP
jgi:hypothetical protein